MLGIAGCKHYWTRTLCSDSPLTCTHQNWIVPCAQRQDLLRHLTLKGEMLYEIWHGLKLSIAHLQEFGTLVWVLLQGQAQQCKILPKLKQRLYVGHEDSPQAIKYYNTDIQKVLTSHNYQFLTPQNDAPSPDVIMVAPNAQHKGEQRLDMLSQSAGWKMTGQLGEKCEDNVLKGNRQSSTNPQMEGERDSSSLMRNCDEEGEPMDTLQKTHGIKRDYH